MQRAPKKRTRWRAQLDLDAWERSCRRQRLFERALCDDVAERHLLLYLSGATLQRMMLVSKRWAALCRRRVECIQQALIERLPYQRYQIRFPSDIDATLLFGVAAGFTPAQAIGLRSLHPTTVMSMTLRRLSGPLPPYITNEHREYLRHQACISGGVTDSFEFDWIAGGGAAPVTVTLAAYELPTTFDACRTASRRRCYEPHRSPPRLLPEGQTAALINPQWITAIHMQVVEPDPAVHAMAVCGNDAVAHRWRRMLSALSWTITHHTLRDQENCLRLMWRGMDAWFVDKLIRYSKRRTPVAWLSVSSGLFTR